MADFIQIQRLSGAHFFVFKPPENTTHCYVAWEDPHRHSMHPLRKQSPGFS